MANIPNNEIWYTSSDGTVIENYNSDFGVEIISNVYENGQGIIMFDGNVTSIGTYFSFNYKLTSVTIPSSVTSIGDNAFNNCTGLTSVTIPSSVTSIGVGAFSNSGLTSIIIPGSVTIINDNVFSYCYSLASVTIPSSVTSIGGNAFNHCTGLTSVTIPSSVTSIGGSAFNHCTGLTSVTIPSSVTSIGDGAFSYCNKLTSVTIPSSVTSIGNNIFSYCYSLASVTIQNGVTSIGDGAFSYCNKLTSVTIPSSVTSIGGSAFNNCTGLTSVGIPSSVTRIDSYAFNKCTGLTSVTIPNSVTTISNYTFYNCSGLTSVTIPSSVTSIGYGAFDHCNKLTSVVSLNKTPPTQTPPTLSSNFPSSSTDVYVPYSSVDDYKVANRWKNYNIKVYLPELKFKKKSFDSSNIEIGSVIFDENKQTIYLDDVGYNTTPSSIAYCDTAAATAAKTATMPGFELVTGQRIFLQTTVKNSAKSNVTLSVNDTEPKPIKIGTATPTKSNFPASWWIANYDGTNWVLTRIYFSDNTDTKVTQSSTTTDGYRKILLSYNSSTTIGDAITSATNVAYEAVDVEVQPSTGKILSNGFVKNGGTSSQFLKADGSVDENTYSKSSLTQTKNYTSNSAFYTNGSFTYFNSSDYITSISSVNNSYTLVEFDDTSVTTTGTSISIPFNFPTVSGDLIGNENIHYFLLKNISNSNITLTLVPQPSQVISIIGNLTPMTLQANNSIEISTKVMDNNWIISKSMEMPISVERPNLNNVIGVGIITFDGNVTSIGDWAFYECRSLISITIPDSVTSIGNLAFDSCSGLTSTTIPDSVTSIGDYAFSNCSGLTSITIPDSVTNIGSDAFSGCSGLTSITSLNTTPPTINSNTLPNGNNYTIYVPSGRNNYTIYVPSGSVDTYKAAQYWSEKVSQIQAIQ